MGLLEDVLDIICRRGGGGVYAVAQLLGVSEEEVRRVISVLLAEGILRRAEPEGVSPCSLCPLSKFCSRAGASPRGAAVYVLTEKGEALCREKSK